MAGKITWARPIGALIVILSVLYLYASELPVPWWADGLALFMGLTWWVDRSLWKFIVGRKNDSQNQ